MNNQPDNRIQHLLQQSMPPVQGELERDLWPAMLSRMAEPPSIGVPWFDWALLATLALLLVLVPRSIPLLLYHL